MIWDSKHRDPKLFWLSFIQTLTTTIQVQLGHGWIITSQFYMDVITHVKPTITYFQHELPASLTPENRQLVDDLFMWLVQPCLDFIRHECRMLINTSPMHLVFTLMRLYRSLMDEIEESGQEGKDQLSSSQVGAVPYVWLKGHVCGLGSH